MGRLSRHRKIKSCDPFYKGLKEIDTSYNVPVRPSELDSQPAPRKVASLFKCNRKIDKKGKHSSGNKMKKSEIKLNLSRREGETRKEYFQRLDQQTAQEIAQIMVKERHVSQKRKKFLKARKEKSRKNKNIQEVVHKDFATDNVKFGEVVNEPPNLTTKPRHVELKQETKSKSKVTTLLLHSKLENSRPVQKEEGNVSVFKSKKRKHMTGVEQQHSDKRRQEAIDAYRKQKKRTAVLGET